MLGALGRCGRAYERQGVAAFLHQGLLGVGEVVVAFVVDDVVLQLPQVRRGGSGRVRERRVVENVRRGLALDGDQVLVHGTEGLVVEEGEVDKDAVLVLGELGVWVGVHQAVQVHVLVVLETLGALDDLLPPHRTVFRIA